MKNVIVLGAGGNIAKHGATPTTAMTHIAIVEQLDGKAVEWMEKIREDERDPSS